MTTDEARGVLTILCYADGECKHCAASLIRSFVASFGFKTLAVQIFRKCFYEEGEEKEASDYLFE